MRDISRYVTIKLTRAEAAALWLIIGNGWDFKGYGEQNTRTQQGAMRKFRSALERAGQPNTI